jgi:serine protease Do
MEARHFSIPDVPIRSTGSGFIIDPAGFIVTEDHVVENAEKVTVTFQDGKRHAARIIGRDPKTGSMSITPYPLSAGATAILRG